ncbi:uncharacterized protein LOC111341120, partial [Stylophora pistillata]|uniref:uncharacterized protein LOC111341120 n=1 Tax=Stylophora pistillata TaxID=50429 RepID=UPI000C03EDD4
MYDIACLLAHHLKESLLEGVDVAIPIFHCYGHKASCQIQYSPRRIKGTGLTDGEGVERLWSFLRRFSSVTKEMSAHKRTDVLTDGLLHYAQHLYHKFGVTLKAKFARAETLLHDVSAKLEELTEKLPGIHFKLF